MEKNNYSEKGYTLVELLVIIGVLIIVIVIAGSFSADFSKRRNIDKLTNGISGNLQLAKLQAARDGVEYRFSVSENADEDMIEIKRERGDSNNLSTSWTVVGSLQLKVENYVDVTLVPTIPMIIKPSGSLDPTMMGSLTESSCIIKPKNNTDYKRCGQVSMTRLGHLDIIKGNWDGTNCNIIKDAD